ncbi:hypothetical protein [Streptomyces sp. CC228A]|nr:hypothetical protein [Streptomyces sp. CC228A]
MEEKHLFGGSAFLCRGGMAVGAALAAWVDAGVAFTSVLPSK